MKDGTGEEGKDLNNWPRSQISPAGSLSACTHHAGGSVLTRRQSCPVPACGLGARKAPSPWPSWSPRAVTPWGPVLLSPQRGRGCSWRRKGSPLTLMRVPCRLAAPSQLLIFSPQVHLWFSSSPRNSFSREGERNTGSGGEVSPAPLWQHQPEVKMAFLFPALFKRALKPCRGSPYPEQDLLVTLRGHES